MAIIAGTTVRWDASPRIIEIPSPLTEVDIFDLHRTIRDLEDDDVGMAFPSLGSISGGEALGGGVTVGWTLELQNAQLAFAGRTTATSTGTATSNDTDGETLTDTAATFITDGVKRGDTVINTTTNATETVLRVLSETQMTTRPISGGSRADWQIGDAYRVYENAQCKVAGGNLVAVDMVGNSISAIMQSPNVQIMLASSSSATNENAKAIEYSSFANAVHINPATSNTGTEYPVGTPEYPVNNVADAITIANSRGFSRLFVHGSVTLTTGHNASSKIITAHSHMHSTITIEAGANVVNTLFENVTISGVLDGGNVIENCSVGALTYLNGTIKNSAIDPVTIQLGGGVDAQIIDCYAAGTINSYLTLDMNGPGQSIQVLRYAGSIHVQNLVQAGDECAIDTIHGHIDVEASCTAGLVYLTGYGELDNNTGGATVANEQIDPADLVKNVTLSKKMLVNKQILDPSTGTNTIYDDDDATPLVSGTTYLDTAGTKPYDGVGAVHRRNKLA